MPANALDVHARVANRETSRDVEVRRVRAPEKVILAAARRWALALEANQRHKLESHAAETAELALYDELAHAEELRSAERALYEVVVAVGLTSD